MATINRNLFFFKYMLLIFFDNQFHSNIVLQHNTEEKRSVATSISLQILKQQRLNIQQILAVKHIGQKTVE